MNVYCFVESPIGALMLSSDGEYLTGLYMGKPSKRPNTDSWTEDPEHPVLKATAHQLEQYFTGKRRAFELPLKFNGTPFQRQVWQLLTEIPFGETRTYGQLARQLHNPSACRAVGLANGKNPIAVIVPCHRVIGADGSLTGFGGGLPRKEWLLSHEGFAGIRNLDLAI